MKKNNWTKFWDMNSGGGTKEKWDIIYIEAPREQAELIFYNRFGHNPNRVSCTCCGEDYSITEGENLTQLTAFHRNCRYATNFIPGKGETEGKYLEEEEEVPEGLKVSNLNMHGECITLEEYIKQPEVLIIYNKDINSNEKKGKLPEQGYIWV